MLVNIYKFEKDDDDIIYQRDLLDECYPNLTFTICVDEYIKYDSDANKLVNNGYSIHLNIDEYKKYVSDNKNILKSKPSGYPYTIYLHIIEDQYLIDKIIREKSIRILKDDVSSVLNIKSLYSFIEKRINEGIETSEKVLHPIMIKK